MSTARLVSIFLNESDEWHRRPLHLELLRMLHDEGLSGGTVLRAVAGFTRGHAVQTTSLVDVARSLPLVVQFVESQENVDKVMPRVREMAPGRLVTVEDVEILQAPGPQRT